MAAPPLRHEREHHNHSEAEAQTAEAALGELIELCIKARAVPCIWTVIGIARLLILSQVVLIRPPSIT